MDEMAKWGLQRRHDELAVNFRTAWDLHLKFYTVFLVAHLTALGWFYGSPRPVLLKWVISIFFIILAGLNIMIGVRMLIYSSKTKGEADDIAIELKKMVISNDLRVDVEKCFKSTIPCALAVYSGYATAIGMLIVLSLWFSLACLS